MILRVTTTSDCSVTCQIEQEDLVNFDENPVPDVDIDLGGWSGAPALVVGKLSYPLIGVVRGSIPTLHRYMKVAQSLWCLCLPDWGANWPGTVA